MRIICCYSDTVHPLTRKSIEAYAPGTEYVKTEGLFGYNWAIASRWTGESDLVVIEGDKEINPDTVESFEACDEPWCTYECPTFPEPYTKITNIGLACAKFSVSCQDQISVDDFCRPDYPMRLECPDCLGAGCWRYLDTRIATAILSKCVAFSPHVHGRIAHHHNYPPDWARQRGLEP